MNIQYLTDEHGERTAAVVPIQEWRRLLALVEKSQLSEEEVKERAEAYAELERGEALDLDMELLDW
jgi:hypothetical protein